MSEPKLISPMLDNFSMGDPISDRNGVRCCPAMEHYSDAKYIVKIISVPADPSKLDALLLSGAYPDKDAALAYYSMLADDVMHEARLLEELSQLDGFMPFDACQIEPMEDGNGYDVYLLSSYGTTLQRRIRNGTLTHLEALNLGLDLCNALTVARRSGYLYADLKPSNVYITTERGYRIGDLGFIKLDGLKYTSLPERYRSQYTAPEITDAYSSLNSTLDIYAVGLILYQVFNNGMLPFSGDNAPAEDFPAPAFADYEMAEIILKACSPNPEDRWQEPVDMGKALVEYMQRNGAHDAPITPISQSDDAPLAETAPQDEEAVTGAYEATDESPAEPEDPSETPIETEDNSEESPAEEAIPITEESIFTEDDDGNLTFISDAEDDETLPDEEDSQVDYDEISDEVSDMMQQADELIAHEAPDPVVQPDPIDVPIPPPIELSTEEPNAEENSEASEAGSNEVESADAHEGENEIAVVPEPEAPDTTENDDTEEAPKKKKHVGKWILNSALALLAVILIIIGCFYYRHYYLQPIDAILLEGSEEGELTVLVTTSFDTSKLIVVCSDTYGNKLESPVINGRASFTGLSPNSAYTVKVVPTGFHRLTGDTSAAYTTPVQTTITQLTAVTGAEEGSIIIGFAIDGPDADQWCISYIGDDGNIKEMNFAGHTVTLNGFTVGNTYTFKLKAANGQSITGNTEVSYTASKLVKAEDLMITGCIDNTLTASWNAPDGQIVENWTVRCYSESGFDETKVISDTTASFQIEDITASYTVEVTASGMSVSERTYAAANSTTVTNFHAEETESNTLSLNWECGSIPSGGWKLLYTVDGSAAQEINCTENTASISPVIPGAKYRFTLQPADGTSVLGGVLAYKVAEPELFDAYGTSAEKLEFLMCCPPSYYGWDRWDVPNSDYRTEFVAGEKAGFAIENHGDYSNSDSRLDALFVVRDENGAVLDASVTTHNWDDMWTWGYCELDIPFIPQAAGNYSVSVFFNNEIVVEVNFTVVNS